jgi:hypothetical protein
MLVFVQDRTLRLDPALPVRPLDAPARDVGFIAFACDDLFEAEPFDVDEVLHRSIIDLEAVLGEFGHKPAQREPSFPDAVRQKDVMHAGNRLRLVPAPLAGHHVARVLKSPHRGRPQQKGVEVSASRR